MKNLMGKSHHCVSFFVMYSINLKNLLRNWMHQGLQSIIVFINHDLGLSLTYFMGRSNLVT